MGLQLVQLMLFEGEKKIVAYEPKRHLAFNLMANIYQQHGLVWPDNIELYHMALGNRHGRLTLRTPVIRGDMHHGWSSLVDNIFNLEEAQKHYGDQFIIEEEHVQISTLDSQGLENVTFLKIDVEGAEEDVLRGGMELLKRDKPIINIELVEFVRPGCIAAVRQLLADIGYQGFFMYGNNQIFPMENFRLDQHQVSQYDGFNVVNKKEPYIWEFQFIHQDDAWGQAKLREIYGPLQTHIPPPAV